MSELRRRAGELFEEMVAVRRDIHAHPELGMQETRTSALVRDQLAKAGVDEILTPIPTGVIGVIRGRGGPGKCVAVRADMDALPVVEQTGLPFASTVEGVMHACGHDMHTAMLLGLARLLCDVRDRFSGTVKLIFQPGEEVLPGGARAMVEAGCMEEPRVDAIYALHVFPSAPETAGTFNLHEGFSSSSFDEFEITVAGRSGHGSAPHTGSDAVVCAGYLVTALQQIVSRRVNPQDMALLNVGAVHGGAVSNIIPDRVSLVAEARYFKAEVRQTVLEQIDRVCAGIGTAFDCRIDVRRIPGYDAVCNDSGLMDTVRRALTEELGESSWRTMPQPFAGSEDFSFYGSLTGTPEAMFLVDAGHGETLVPLHHPRCAFDESIMPGTVAGMAAIVLETLRS